MPMLETQDANHNLVYILSRKNTKILGCKKEREVKPKDQFKSNLATQMAGKSYKMN
jgi:hypothetical protein